MAKLESLYYSLPIPLQNLLCSWKGWQLYRLRYAGNFQAVQREIAQRTGWSQEEIVRYRDQRLRTFIQHSVQTVPFYRRLFQEQKIVPDDIQGLHDLKQLPLLSKAEVRTHFQELLSEAVPAKERLLLCTSGTTGTGLRVVTTQHAQQEKWAFAWRFRRWHGVERDEWCAYFSSRPVVPLSQTAPPFWRFNLLGKQILFSAYHMSPANLGAYLQAIQSSKPVYLQGYPSLLSLLATYLVESGTELGYTPRCILTNSESLLPHQVEIIQRAFGVRPVQRYSMVEAVAGISECALGKLHVDEDFSAVEFMPNGDDYTYRLIGTGFSNTAFPLIRYDTGDLVTLTNEACPCGRPGRIVRRIDGRQEDYVVLKDGTRFGRVSRLMHKAVNIHEAQIYQKIAGEITLRIVRGQQYTAADEGALRREIESLLGAALVVKIDYVEQLDRSRSGKLRFVISDVAQRGVGPDCHQVTQG